MKLNSGLIFKWLKSENTSSQESRRLGKLTRQHLGVTSRQYRKMLSEGRRKTKVLERLMSANEWDKIDFSKIPSRAGMIYKNAFARHDLERIRQGATQSYEDFAKDKNTKVNAKALYPFDVTKQAMEFGHWGDYYDRGNKSQDLNNTERLMINKYWQNLEDVFNGYSYNGICVCDVSGSMYGDPLAVAISIAMYCAEQITSSLSALILLLQKLKELISLIRSIVLPKLIGVAAPILKLCLIRCSLSQSRII